MIWRRAHLCVILISFFLVIQCCGGRRSNQQGWVTLGQNLGRKGLTDVSQILTWSARDMAHGPVCKCYQYAKEIVSISSAVWAQCTNVTDRQTNIPSLTSDLWMWSMLPFCGLFVCLPVTFVHTTALYLFRIFFKIWLTLVNPFLSKFCPKVTLFLLIWATETFDDKLQPND